MANSKETNYGPPRVYLNPNGRMECDGREYKPEDLKGSVLVQLCFWLICRQRQKESVSEVVLEPTEGSFNIKSIVKMARYLWDGQSLFSRADVFREEIGRLVLGSEKYTNDKARDTDVDNFKVTNQSLEGLLLHHWRDFIRGPYDMRRNNKSTHREMRYIIDVHGAKDGAWLNWMGDRCDRYFLSKDVDLKITDFSEIPDVAFLDPFQNRLYLELSKCFPALGRALSKVGIPKVDHKEIRKTEGVQEVMRFVSQEIEEQAQELLYRKAITEEDTQLLKFMLNKTGMSATVVESAERKKAGAKRRVANSNVVKEEDEVEKNILEQDLEESFSDEDVELGELLSTNTEIHAKGKGGV